MEIKIILLCLLGSILVWYLNGFSKKRRIDRENQHWHSWGNGKRIMGYIDGDGGPSWFPWVSMPWPFKKMDSPSFWSQKVNANMPVKNSIGNTITYGEKQKIAGIPFEIVDATDITNKIRKNSLFYFRITVRFPDSGISFEIVLRTLFNIFRPMGLLTLQKNILDYSQGEIDDAIEPWFIDQEIDQKNRWSELTVNATGELDEKMSLAVHMIQWMERFRIDAIEKIIVGDGLNFREYLDTKKFKKHGFCFKELSLFLGYSEGVVNILKERQKQNQKAEERNTNINAEKAKVIARITQVKDAEANKEATEKEWIINQQILDRIALAQGIVAESYKASTLVINGQTNSSLDAFTGALIGGMTKPKTKQREVNNETDN